MHHQWTKYIPASGNREALYEEFKARALELTVKVQRVSREKELTTAIFQVIDSLQAKRIALPPLTLVGYHLLEEQCGQRGIHLERQLDRTEIEKADLGISEFHMAISDTGTLFQDASSLHSRLVSMLPPAHLALVKTRNLVANMAGALEIIAKVYGNKLPPYLSFVTGPSKTADIERVLTIGVHGPGDMSIIFVDQEALS